jgi:hypothetical protein
MAPNEDRSTAPKNQVVPLWTRGRKQVRRPRRRVCLLKGCERRYRPVHPLARYCSEECRKQARRWREWKARQRYRQSPNGKQKRRAQSRRYRMRRKRPRGAKRGSGKAREGHRKKNYFAGPAIGRAAMRSSRAVAVPRCSGFVRSPVGGLGSGFGSGNSAGGNERPSVGRDCDCPCRLRVNGGERAELVRRYCAGLRGVHKFREACS